MNQILIDHINITESKYIDFVDRSNKDDAEIKKQTIADIAAYARGDKQLNGKNLSSLFNFLEYHFLSFTKALIIGHNTDGVSITDFWSEKDPFIKGIVNEETINNENYAIDIQFIIAKFNSTKKEGLEGFLNYLKKQGFSDKKIIEVILFNSYLVFQNSQNQQTAFSHYIQSNLKTKSSLLGLRKKKGLAELLDDFIQSKIGEGCSNEHFVLEFLLAHAPNVISNIQRYLVNQLSEYNEDIILNVKCVEVLLNVDAVKYENDILLSLEPFSGSREFTYKIYKLLNEKFDNKYNEQIIEIGEKYLNEFVAAPPHGMRLLDNMAEGGSISIDYSNFLLKLNFDHGRKRIFDYTKQSKYISPRYLNFIDEKFREDSVPYFINCLDLNPNIADYDYFSTLFSHLEKYSINDYLNSVLDFGVKNKTKYLRKYASEILIPYTDNITPRAQELLDGKVDQRIFGAMVLQHSTDPVVLKQLMQQADTERSDDTRDIMIDTLYDLRYKNSYTIEEAKQMILMANDRKKLNKWNEKWINELELPKLYWNNGDFLNEKEIRFIFYRSKRAKGLNSDIEAKQVFDLLDHSKATKFALYLLDAFKESNSDNKIKHYTVIAALIGGDTILNKLHGTFKSSVTNKRYHLSGTLVGAIAMVGSDKALRIVEMISRKYSNKRPQIRKGAIEALQAAATELNITLDQLADRIVPDFDFEHNYFHFQVEEENYRAFIGKDFKLQYFNEDNKLRKSIPKNAPKETVAQLKEIAKEIKVTVKAQSGRLEKYLISERRWPVADWRKYYQNNPLMLIYVQRLLWGLYDMEGKLKEVFFCDDDLDFYNVDDEEVDISNEYLIGIVHPLHMSADLLRKWKRKVYDLDFDFEFDIVNREITLKSEHELEQSYSKLLDKKQVPKGADSVVGVLTKRGWHKSPSDGGYLIFSKVNEANNIVAVPNIHGPAAYYQGGNTDAFIYEVDFSRHSGREKVLIKDVPEVFYSEVFADLKNLLKE